MIMKTHGMRAHLLDGHGAIESNVGNPSLDEMRLDQVQQLRELTEHESAINCGQYLLVREET
jgi:hypothetical protein